VAAPSLAVVKAGLNGALRNQVYWKVSLPVAGGLALDDLERSLPIQTILWFCDSSFRKELGQNCLPFSHQSSHRKEGGG